MNPAVRTMTPEEEAQWQADLQAGALFNTYEHGVVPIMCAYCGTTFTRPIALVQSRIRNGLTPPRFCSVPCQNVSRRGARYKGATPVAQPQQPRYLQRMEPEEGGQS